MRFINWNIDQFVLDKLPINKRTTINVAWLLVLLQPLRTIYLALKTFYTSIETQINYGSQTIIMESVLNDNFDNIIRRIYIVTASETDTIRNTYFVAENNEKTFTTFIAEPAAPLYSYFSSEAQGTTDFYVNVPLALVYDAVLMNKLINQCKLISKRYKIITF